ncbi:MAG: hypothetical protein HYY13_09765 [Nitrospirae bacterium]|nr:hypothetical protein [Nitrospirota bacterium]
MISRTAVVFLGFLIHFQWLSLYHAVQTKFPLDLVAVLLLGLPLLGLSAGLLTRRGEGRLGPVWAAGAAVFAWSLCFSQALNLHFLVSSIYYPYQKPAGYALGVAIYVLAWIACVPYFGGLGTALRTMASARGAGPPWPAMALGFALAYPAAYAARTAVGPYLALLLASGISLAWLGRGVPLRAAALLLLAGGWWAYHAKPTQLYLWRARTYTASEERWSPYYRLTPAFFNEGRCAGGVFNQLMIWYSCSEYDLYPRESRLTIEAMGAGRRKLLELGRTDGMTTLATRNVSPDVRSVTVEIDPLAVRLSRTLLGPFNMNLFRTQGADLMAADWRHVLRDDGERYDFIYLDGLGIRLYTIPLTIIPQENFLYSREAYSDIFRRRMAPGGLLAINWGSTRSEEVYPLVANLPPEIHARAYWGTMTTFPFTGLPLFFVIASEDDTTLERIGREFLAMGNLQEVPLPPEQVEQHRYTDDRPHNQRKLPLMLLVPTLPLAFLVALAFARWMKRSGSGWKNLSPGISAGFLNGVAEALLVSRASILFPLGPAQGWVPSAVMLWGGRALGGLRSPSDRASWLPPVAILGSCLAVTGTVPYSAVTASLALAGVALGAMTCRALHNAGDHPHLHPPPSRGRNENIPSPLAGESASGGEGGGEDGHRLGSWVLGLATGIYSFQWIQYALGFRGTAVMVGVLGFVVAGRASLFPLSIKGQGPIRKRRSS